MFDPLTRDGGTRSSAVAVAVVAMLIFSIPATRASGQDGGLPGTPNTPGTGTAAVCADVTATKVASPGAEHDHAGDADGDDPGSVVLAPFDLVYVDTMVARDTGTAALGRVVADRATDLRVREFGETLATGGDASVVALGDWRDAWYPDAPAVEDLQLVQLVDEAESGSGAPADGGMGGGDPALPADDLLTLCTVTDSFDAVALEIVATRIETDVALAAIAFGRVEHVELLAFAQSRGESGQHELAVVADLATGITASTPAP